MNPPLELKLFIPLGLALLFLHLSHLPFLVQHVPVGYIIKYTNKDLSFFFGRKIKTQ